MGHIKRIEESLSAQSGNVRVEVAGFSGKKATRIEGEKIAKKQLGSGVKKIKSTAAAGAVSVREIAARTESELSIDASRALKLANDALANGRYKKALEYYAQVLAGGANAQGLSRHGARLGRRKDGCGIYKVRREIYPLFRFRRHCFRLHGGRTASRCLPL